MAMDMQIARGTFLKCTKKSLISYTIQKHRHQRKSQVTTWDPRSWVTPLGLGKHLTRVEFHIFLCNVPGNRFFFLLCCSFHGTHGAISCLYSIHIIAMFHKLQHSSTSPGNLVKTLLGSAAEAPMCNASMQHECWFESQILHFWFSILLMSWESIRKWFKYLILCHPCVRLRGSSRLLDLAWPGPRHCGHLQSEPLVEHLYLFLCLWSLLHQ